MAKKGKAYSKQSVKKTGRERKETLVAEIVEKIDSSNGLVFTDYKGITHQQLEALRKELKAVDSSLLIAKNSLMKISMGKSKNFADYKDNEALEGPAATLFIGKDSIEPLKKLQKSIKDTGLPVIKFGVLEGQLLDEAGVLKLATLPSREVLLAQFVGMLNSPIQRFVSGLNAIPQKFVMTLDAIAKAKPKVTTKSGDAVQSADSAEAFASPANDSANASDATPTSPEPTEQEPAAEESAGQTTDEPNNDSQPDKKSEEQADAEVENEPVKQTVEEAKTEENKDEKSIS
jgi:large subunit ribosomal protein L10